MEISTRKLILEIRKHHPDADCEIVERAYAFAQKAHEGQLRISGVPYFGHVFSTALRLAQWRMPPQIVAVGLLHDVSEDTHFTVEDIRKEFGKDVATMVEAETKLTTIQYQGQARYAENLRKMFMAMAKDVRPIIVRFADRIDNLQSLHVHSEAKQKRIALETLEIYAPIANRLGMGYIRGELEDLSFKYVYPKEYEWVHGLVSQKLEEMDEHRKYVNRRVHEMLEDAGIKTVSIHGRTKRLWSLYKKLQSHNYDITRIFDLVAERIIVPSLQDCYGALGVIHQHWRPLKGRIKDYIAQPKPNGYRSIHTTVFCEKGEVIEFQIRTPEIHDEAEYGIAAHWSYKEKGTTRSHADSHTSWLKDLAKIQTGITDQKEFLNTLESLKIDFFNNRIFLLTPKGDVIDLPEGSTAIDFAYAIHTDVGNTCVGVRVNHEQSSLDKPLHSGDVVEVVRDKNRKGPSADWLKYTKTAHAREKIKENLRRNKMLGWIGDLAKKATFRKAG